MAAAAFCAKISAKEKETLAPCLGGPALDYRSGTNGIRGFAHSGVPLMYYFTEKLSSFPNT